MKEVFDIEPGDDKTPSSLYQVSSNHFEDPNHISTKTHVLLQQLRRNKIMYSNLSIISRRRAGAGEGSHFPVALVSWSPIIWLFFFFFSLADKMLDYSQFTAKLIEDVGQYVFCLVWECCG